MLKNLHIAAAFLLLLFLQETGRSWGNAQLFSRDRVELIELPSAIEEQGETEDNVGKHSINEIISKSSGWEWMLNHEVDDFRCYWLSAERALSDITYEVHTPPPRV